MYRSCHELAVEGSLHDLAEELLAKHLLSQLHQLKKNILVVSTLSGNKVK